MAFSTFPKHFQHTKSIGEKGQMPTSLASLCLTTSQTTNLRLFQIERAEPHSSVSSVADRTGGRWCDRIHSSLTAVCCFDNGYVGKQPVV